MGGEGHTHIYGDSMGGEGHTHIYGDSMGGEGHTHIYGDSMGGEGHTHIYGDGLSVAIVKRNPSDKSHCQSQTTCLFSRKPT